MNAIYEPTKAETREMVRESRRLARLTSPTHVRRFLLEQAKARRAHKFKRVSGETIERVEAETRALCLRIVGSAPSKGVTL